MWENVIKTTDNMKLNKIHHVAVICSDYERSKRFYADVLGLKIVSEHYRKERDSWKADCWLGGTYVVELFSFPNPPARPSRPEAAGLRHLAFEVDDVAADVGEVEGKGGRYARMNIPANGLCFSAILTGCRLNCMRSDVELQPKCSNKQVMWRR